MNPLRALIRAWFGVALWQRVIGGMAAGVALGLLWPAAAPGVAILGELFVRLIRMLVVPIVFISIAAGIAALGDPRRLGSLGLRTIGVFALTTACAIAIGMAMGLVFQPGAGADLASAAPHPLGTARSAREQLVGIVPLNIVAALAEGDMLAIIFAAALLGVGTIVASEAGRPFAAGLQSLAAVLFHLVRLVMEATPFGVFALVAGAVAANGLAVFANIGWLALCVLIASATQMLLVHTALLTLLARRSPAWFFRRSIDALVVGFSTSSSSATLPVALRVAVEKLGVARPVAATVLPLGASIGKDGTAMYVGLLSVFALQALAIPADARVLATVFLMGALTAFGTAPVPSAALFMLSAVLTSVGASPVQVALLVGFILPFDRLLDMTRTVPSVSANLTVCTVVARLEGALAPAAADQSSRGAFGSET